MSKKPLDPMRSAEGYFIREGLSPHPQASRKAPRIVLTGGPSGGKTMTTIRLDVSDVGLLAATVPEAATVLLKGGFTKGTLEEDGQMAQSLAWRKSFQFGVAMTQLALETGVAAREKNRPIGGRSRKAFVCDRGLADGAAYLQGGVDELSDMVQMSQEQILGRYGLVIHLTTSAKQPQGYQKGTESYRHEEAEEARSLDDRTLEAWEGHPNRVILDIPDHFERNQKVLSIVRDFLIEQSQ